MNFEGFCPVGKLERLLAATDGSLYSEGAVREAISFAKRCASRLYFLRVLETTPEYETIGASVFEKEEAEALQHLDTIRKRALDEGITCETIFHHGENPQDFILDEAASKKIDMIVLGRRGLKGLAKILIGEVASKVIAHAPCKVLVVPKAARIEYRTILIATDGSEHGTAALSEAIGIAKRCGSRVVALSSARTADEMAEAKTHAETAAKVAEKEGVPVEIITPVEKSHQAILEAAGGMGVDLIVMGTYGKTGFKKFLMGSTTEKVIGKAGCAVLVVRAG